MSLEPPCAESVRLDTALLVVGVAHLRCGLTLPKGHCQGHLCLSWLGYSEILLPRVPLFKGQDWGGTLFPGALFKKDLESGLKPSFQRFSPFRQACPVGGTG